MGWWTVQGSNVTIGDLPLDALGDAIEEVLRAYQEEWQRPPTREEWTALLTTVLHARLQLEVTVKKP